MKLSFCRHRSWHFLVAEFGARRICRFVRFISRWPAFKNLFHCISDASDAIGVNQRVDRWIEVDCTVAEKFNHSLHFLRVWKSRHSFYNNIYRNRKLADYESRDNPKHRLRSSDFIVAESFRRLSLNGVSARFSLELVQRIIYA